MRTAIALAAMLALAGCGRPPAPPRSLVGGGTVVELAPGRGAVAEDGSWIEVRYDACATLASAPVDPFDSTCHSEPFLFRLGHSRVLPGFAEGILGMHEGARCRITLPPGAAYGASGKGTVPAGATLEYDVALERVFQRTASGLQYVERKPGTGASPKSGQRVAIRLAAWSVETGRSLVDRRRAGDRANIVLGAGDAIPALEEALTMMKPGASWRLGVSPELGFGSQGHPPLLAPGQDFVLDVDLLEVQAAR